MNPRRVAALASLLALAGCTVQPKPPAFILNGHRTLVVLPFGNATADPALGTAVQDAVVVGLTGLAAVPVVDPARAVAALGGAAGSPEGDPAVRLKLVDAFRCDLILVGSTTGYDEATHRDDPRRIPITFKQGQYKWGYSDVSTVHVEATVALIDAATGARLWIHPASQLGQFSRWMDLPWAGDNPDPAERSRWKTEHPGGDVAAAAAPTYGADANMGRARATAIQKVAEDVLAQFRGVGGWVPAAAAASSTTPASSAAAPPAAAPAPAAH